MASSRMRGVHRAYIPKIDEEHEDLAGVAEDLHHLLSRHGFTPQAQSVFREFIGQIGAHLASEERMMRTASYPSYGWHKTQHDTARKRVEGFADRVEEGDEEAACELVDFFKGWLKDHSGLHDRMMSAYLRNHEREQTASES